MQLLLSQGRAGRDPMGMERSLQNLLVLDFSLFPECHGEVRIEQAALDVKGPRFTLHILMKICWSPRKEPTDFVLVLGSFPHGSSWVVQRKLNICGENVRKDVRPRENTSEPRFCL